MDYNTDAMPRKSKLKLPPLGLGEETPGRRLARLRKERGYTQVELAERTGLIQTLISDYERDRLRISGEMAVRFAMALEVSTDELLGLKPIKNGKKASRRVLRRLEKIEGLPPRQQMTLLRTIDTFLKAAEK